MKKSVNPLRAFKKNGLGNFKLETVGWQPGIGKRGLQDAKQVAPFELRRRKINR